MAVLTVSNVTKSFADILIIESISFEVQKGEHIGLVGINGSGKTTLFKTLTGEYDPDIGSVIFAKDCNVGYMEQHVCKDFDKTAFEEVMTVFSDLVEMEKELEAVTQRLQQSLSEEEMNRLILRQTELNDRFVDFGGLTCRGRAESALKGLGFSEDQIHNKIGVFSGGQKAKLQLAKMLLSGANLLLLDEPTNHLDINAVEWLETFLGNYSGAYIVISHDLYFLDKITARTFEMEYKHLKTYKGNYTKFLKLKAEARLAAQRVYDSKQTEIKRIEGIIEQQRRWNQQRNYVTIASKQKQIDRIASDMEKPDSDPASIHFQFKASRRSGDEVLQVKDLALSFDDVSIFKNVEMDIRRGEKIFLIGPNGCGKTSLFKILLKKYMPVAGNVKFGAAVDVGYYEQAQSGLHDEKTVIDEIWDEHLYMDQTQVRSALAVFLFRGEDVFKQVGALSGGERARILLLKLMLSKTNFLLLDEPTNHLDISSCEVLEEALADYDGTLFVVSHDRYLINKIADKIYYLDEAGAKLYLGNYDAFLEAREIEAGNAVQIQEKPKINPYKLKKENEAALRKFKGDLGRCEKAIEENDEALEKLAEELSSEETAADYEKTMELSVQISEREAIAEKLLEQWTELSEGVEEAQRNLDLISADSK